MTVDRLLIVLNKVDLLPAGNREAQVEKVKERICRVLKGTKFADVDTVGVSACPGAEEGSQPEGVSHLVLQFQSVALVRASSSFVLTEID